MGINTTNHTFRVAAAAAIATIGLFGLAACSSGEPQVEEKPSTSDSAPTETEATEATEEAAASGQTKCTAEQLTTISSASGVAVPAEAVAVATGEFAPASVIGDLPTVCVLSFENVAGSGAYAVLPGGAATLTAVAANATAAGGEVTEAGGMLTGTVDGLTVLGMNFSQLTQETAGFENVEDLVVIVSTGLLG